MKPYRTLLELDFISLLNESNAVTQTGSQFLNAYKASTMRSPVTHQLINNFINESKQYQYDNGVVAVARKIAEFINENKYTWQLSSICENIKNNDGRYNALNLNAVSQVETLLEMKEDDVIQYIKSGALKNVMYVESFQRVVRSVLRDMPVVQMNEQYSTFHPISFTESHDNALYFSVYGRTYKIDENNALSECNVNEVSEQFNRIMSLLSSNKIEYINETISYDSGSFTYKISEQGKCVKEMNGNKYEMTVEQMRENNIIYLSTTKNNRRNEIASILETLAQICESFDSIAVLDNVSVVSTSRDRFVTITNESATEMTAFLLESTHAYNRWETTGDIISTLKFIKNNTNTDLTESYKDAIDNVLENRSEEEKKEMERQLNEDKINSRREKIAQLTEKFKNDPIRLAVLAQVSEDLHALDK